MKILIKYATRGRASWFKRTIMNILETISPDANYLILISADSDDVTMTESRIEEFLAENKVPHILCFGKSESKVHAINRDMTCAKFFDWDLLINMSDDMEFVVPNWDQIMISKIRIVWKGSLDFFAHFSDGYVHDKLPTMSIMGREYYERDGYIYHPSYKSFSCDAEAMYVAQMRRRHHYFPEVLFKHEHPTYKKTPDDDIYHRNSLATEHDTRNYWNRLNRYFDEPHDHKTPIPFKEFIGKQPQGL